MEFDWIGKLDDSQILNLSDQENGGFSVGNKTMIWEKGSMMI